MPPQLDDTFWIFALFAALLGLPALLVLLLAGLAGLRRPARPPSHPDQVKNPDAILLLLGGMTRLLSGLAGIFGALGGFLLKGAALVAALALPIAALCALTAYGLHGHATWVRGLAGALGGGACLAVALVFLMTRSVVRMFTLLPLLLSAWVLWAAVRGWR